jgi:hypothetical protein
MRYTSFVLDRHDLTDEEWARLEPLLPDQTPRRGGRWADHRRVINGVFWPPAPPLVRQPDVGADP